MDISNDIEERANVAWLEAARKVGIGKCADRDTVRLFMTVFKTGFKAGVLECIKLRLGEKS